MPSPQRSPDPSHGTRLHGFFCVGIPVLLSAVAAPALPLFAEARHDEGSLRALAGGGASPWHALDGVLPGLFAVVPLGTRTFRASLSSFAWLSAFGLLLYLVTRSFLHRCVHSPRLGATLACTSTLTICLSPTILASAAAPTSPLLSAALCLGLLALPDESPFSFPLLSLLFFVDPIVGAAALAQHVAQRRPWGAPATRWIVLLFTPLLPLLSWLRVKLDRPYTQGGATSLYRMPNSVGEFFDPTWTLLVDDVGPVFSLLGASGLALSLFQQRARGPALTFAIGGALCMGALAMSKARAPAAVLMAMIALFAAVAMHMAVRATLHAPIAMAKATATMVLLLALSFPLTALDERLSFSNEPSVEPTRTFGAVATGSLPPASLLLTTEPRVVRRLLADRAAGGGREDIHILPLYDMRSRLATRAFGREPLLSGVFRDMALSGKPEEYALSSLSAARPTYMLFDPSWDRTLAKHLVPAGIFDRFEAEPRGPSDRKRAFDHFGSVRPRLYAAVVTSSDEELLLQTRLALRARALGTALSGDRLALARAVDDLYVFSPGDPLGLEVTKRAFRLKDDLPVRDLRP